MDGPSIGENKIFQTVPRWWEKVFINIIIIIIIDAG
jgi:hypothetical protein